MTQDIEEIEATWRIAFKAMIDVESVRRMAWVDTAALRIAIDETVKAKMVASQRLAEAEKKLEEVEATWRLAFKAMLDAERLSIR
ncbi:MAG: hypothetical protein ACREBU_03220 [Nitrososphaera sp.]